MIWDYQRSPLFTVLWRGRLELRKGESIKFIGKLSEATKMQASVAIRSDGNVIQQPDSDQLGEEFPLTGKVVSTLFRKGNTYVHIYQTTPNLFNFGRLQDNRAFLNVPEFWDFLEQRSDFEKYLEVFGANIDEYGSRPYSPDIHDDSWTIHRYARIARIYRGDEVRTANGHIVSKVEQLLHLRSKITLGNRLKLHLLTLPLSAGRSQLLSKLALEGSITFENAAFAAYSLVDILASLVNAIFDLNLSDLQVSFTSVLGKSFAEDNSPCLRSKYPDEAITKFWIAQQREWIASLREIRHHLAHRGAISPVYGRTERLLASAIGIKSELVPRIFDVEAEIAFWLEKADVFFTESLRLISDYCLEAVELIQDQHQLPIVLAPQVSSTLAQTLGDFLRLLKESDQENPNRAKHLYSRLHPNWKRRWPYLKFINFIGSVDAISTGGTVMSTSSNEISSIETTVLLSRSGAESSWLLRFEKTKAGRPFLVRREMTVPVGMYKRSAVGSFRARQSGPATNYSCADFQFELTNTGSEKLKNIVIAIAHNRLQVAQCSAGSLEPNESRAVSLSTSEETGTYLPPGGPYLFVTLTQEPVVVRVIYDLDTDQGNEWADEHICANSAQPPVRS